MEMTFKKNVLGKNNPTIRLFGEEIRKIFPEKLLNQAENFQLKENIKANSSVNSYP